MPDEITSELLGQVVAGYGGTQRLCAIWLLS